MSATIERHETREQWLEARRRGIGASESAAVLGISPWKTPLALWADKVQPDLEEEERDDVLFKRGRRLEPLVAEDFRERTGLSVLDHGRYSLAWHGEIPHLYATLDREVRHPEWGPGVLEIKTVDVSQGHRWPAAETQGLDTVVGPEDIPEHVYCQVQHQLAVVGASWGAIACWVGYDFRYWRIAVDAAYADRMVTACAAFWDLVQRREEPPAEAGDSKVLGLLHGKPDKDMILQLPASLIDVDAGYAEAIQLEKKWKGEKERLRVQLEQAMGDAKKGLLPNGVRFSYPMIKIGEKVVAGYSFKRLFRTPPKK